MIPELKKRKNLYYFIKEAGAIRAIPDLIVCYNGNFVAMELKRSLKEASKNTGRIVQQKHEGYKINKAKGLWYLVHPQNYKEVLEDLDRRCIPKHA